jgi:pimeloyl-ACP methyl ester carboxylesterase
MIGAVLSLPGLLRKLLSLQTGLSSRVPQLYVLPNKAGEIANAKQPLHFYSNIVAHTASSKQMLHTWLRSPLSLRLLKRAFENIEPVYSQIRRSMYIFVFNLPQPLANYLGTMGDRWFVKLLHELATGIRPRRKLTTQVSGDQAADFAISSTNPGISETAEQAGAESYPSAVRRRVIDGGWSEKIRLYREGLFRHPWEKSLETIVTLSELDSGRRSRRLYSSGAGLFEDGPPGSLKTASTIIFGRNDPAFELHLCVDGISEYLAKYSQVVVVDKAGHWLPYEEDGRKILEKAIIWALENNRGTLKQSLGGFQNVQLLVEK